MMQVDGRAGQNAPCFRAVIPGFWGWHYLWVKGAELFASSPVNPRKCAVFCLKIMVFSRRLDLRPSARLFLTEQAVFP